jgi:Ca-activated chloride channel family protein
MNVKPRIVLIACVAIAVLLAGCCPMAAPEAEAVVITQISYGEQVEVTREVAKESVAAEEPIQPSTGGETPPNDEPYDAVFYKNYGVNPFIDTEDDHLSTFAIDVDTGSYSIMRRYVSDGYLPPEEAVRVEEYVNYFDQGYDPPSRGEGAFAIHLDGAPSRFGDEKYHLVRVGLQGYEVPAEERKDVVLTFVIDVSGSMDRENRLELVKDALHLLVDKLGPQDQVGIVIYGSQAEVVLEHIYVGKGERRILKAIDRLRPSGSTYAEAGLRLAYQEASAAFDPDAINRVILCSDGVANVGNTGHKSIWDQISEYADQGIYLTTVGFGMGNYNDVLMEQLADHGDGFYAYVDTIDEAERIFVEDLTSTMEVIAKDAKVQVEFNPAVVSRFRLIGYENRDVADEEAPVTVSLPCTRSSSIQKPPSPRSPSPSICGTRNPTPARRSRSGARWPRATLHRRLAEPRSTSSWRPSWPSMLRSCMAATGRRDRAWRTYPQRPGASPSTCQATLR